MKDLRGEMNGLVDAFDITDTTLASTIGRKDGNHLILEENIYIFMSIRKYLRSWIQGCYWKSLELEWPIFGLWISVGTPFGQRIFEIKEHIA